MLLGSSLHLLWSSHVFIPEHVRCGSITLACFLTVSTCSPYLRLPFAPQMAHQSIGLTVPVLSDIESTCAESRHT